MSWVTAYLRNHRRDRKNRAPYGVPEPLPTNPRLTTDEGRVDPSPAPGFWRNVVLEAGPTVPGMTQLDERKYFYWCVAKHHRPGRRVVELGPWVGCSTMAMAAGIRRSAEPRGKVVTIDRFDWDDWALANALDWTVAGLDEEQRARLGDRVIRPRLGDSFLPIFEEYTKSMRDSIDVVDADLEKYTWTGEPIDVLMVDAAKSWPTFDQIIRQFFPSLIDGAVVIHQDYKHHYCYWIHVVTERMLERGVLSLAENVDGLPTQGFRYHRTADFRPADYLASAFTPAERDKLLRRSMNRFRAFYDRMAVVGIYDQYLQVERRGVGASQLFRNAIQAGGFADNYGLHDLLARHKSEVQLLAEAWLAGSAPAADSPGVPNVPALQACWKHSVSFAASGGRKPSLIEIPAFPAEPWTELAMQFRTGEQASHHVRLRVQAMTSLQSAAFYDEEFLLSPGRSQPVVIQLAGRPTVALRWTASTEGAAHAEQQVECIAPMLLA